MKFVQKSEHINEDIQQREATNEPFNFNYEGTSIHGWGEFNIESKNNEPVEEEPPTLLDYPAASEIKSAKLIIPEVG